jgi:hypothetical protein
MFLIKKEFIYESKEDRSQTNFNFPVDTALYTEGSKRRRLNSFEQKKEEEANKKQSTALISHEEHKISAASLFL